MRPSLPSPRLFGHARRTRGHSLLRFDAQVLSSAGCRASKLVPRKEERAMSSKNETEYRGRCFCGAVEVRVVGQPAAMGYCHCSSCRLWSASPVNAFTLWPPEAVTITRGADQLGSFSKTERSIRKWCRSCGGHA